MRLKNPFSLLILTLLPFMLFSCMELKKPFAVQKLLPYERPEELNLEKLGGAEVSELIWVVFKKDLSQKQWESVFQKTRALTKNRTEMALASEKDDEESLLKIDELLIEFADLTSSIEKEDAVAFLRLGEKEDCRFSSSQPLELACSASVTFEKPFSIQQPDLSSIWPFAWLESEAIQMGHRFKIKLREETKTGQTLKLTGELEVLPGSEFKDENGNVIPHDPFGYVEMTVKLKP